MTMTTKMLFYGTLMTGYHNFNVYVKPMLHTGQVTLLGIGTTVDKLPMIVHSDRNVPALYNCECAEGKNVIGEVYEVNQDCKDALDIIEAVAGGFYSVGTVKVRIKGKEEGEGGEAGDDCLVYFKGPSAEKFDLPSLEDAEDVKDAYSKEQIEILKWLQVSMSISYRGGVIEL